VEVPAVIGRYEVELLLGEGEIGRVLLAHDPVLKRQIAIKVLRDQDGLTEPQKKEAASRVREQARAAARLSHPGMIALHDMGDDDHVGLYLVFELVHGPTLRERLHDGPLPAKEVAQLARTLGELLTLAHASGLVHRGVKPENIMLSATGPKLADFGLSRCEAAYSAPEALASGSFGPRADQFALAATLYEALTGRRAFPGEDPVAVGQLVSSGRYTPLKSMLPTLRGFLRLDGIFARAFAKDPEKRFASCEAFGSALAAELQGPRVAFLATSGPTRSSVARATRRWQNGIALIAVAVIFVLILVGRLRQPSAGGTAALKSAASAYAATHPHPGRPSSSVGLAPSGATSAAPSPSTPSSAAPTLDKKDGPSDKRSGSFGAP
jgi:serine/threonine protein kinase